MKRLLFVALFVLFAVRPGWAYSIDGETLWEGTITYTITELSSRIDGIQMPGVPGLSIGDKFEGYYNYLSPIVDGTFGVPLYTGEYFNEHPLYLFRIFVPYPLSFESSDWDFCERPGQVYEWLNSTDPSAGPLITVLGGVVTDFSLNPEIGPVGFDFDLTTFHLVNTGYVSDVYHARGTVQFEAPRLVPEPATMVLIVIGLAGIVGIKQKQLVNR